VLIVKGLTSNLRPLLLETCKVIFVTGRGGRQGREISKFPHFLNTRLTDGDEPVTLRAGRALLHRNISGYSFLLEVE
jgi:hypothetical protein